MIRDLESGRVWDPNDGPPPKDTEQWRYDSVEAWIAAPENTVNGAPAYSHAREDDVLMASVVQAVLARPSSERRAFIAGRHDPNLTRIANQRYADDPAGDAPVTPEERARKVIDTAMGSE